MTNRFAIIKPINTLNRKKKKKNNIEMVNLQFTTPYNSIFLRADAFPNLYIHI